MNNLEAKIIDDAFVSPSERIEALKKIIKKLDSKKANCPVDLHLHTNYSDGFWTPTGLVLEAYRKGMEMIALTDHDGFAGIEEAFKAIKAVEEKTGKKIGFIPGIEISTDYYYETEKKKEIHVLGYFPAKNFDDFKKYTKKLIGRDQAYFEAFRNNRILRIFEMVKKFNNVLPAKVPSIEKVFQVQDPVISEKTVIRGLRRSIAPGRLLTSTGIFQVVDLYRKGRIDEIKDEEFSQEYLEALNELLEGINSPQEFMNEYFHKKQPSAKTGYIGLTESPEWAVKSIKSMGGIPVLAHPAKYMELYKSVLENLVVLGLKGVEVLSDHFKEKADLEDTLDYVSKTYPHLAITIGSDCHGRSVDRETDYTPKNVMGLKTCHNINMAEYKEKINNIFFSE